MLDDDRRTKNVVRLDWDQDLGRLVKYSVRIDESPVWSIGTSDDWDSLHPHRVLLRVRDHSVVRGCAGIVIPRRLPVVAVDLSRDTRGWVAG